MRIRIARRFLVEWKIDINKKIQSDGIFERFRENKVEQERRQNRKLDTFRIFYTTFTETWRRAVQAFHAPSCS